MKEFYKFLDDNGLRVAYVKNFQDHPHPRSRDKTVSEFLLENDPPDYIEHAFIWAFTPETDKYWLNVDERWRAAYRHPEGIPSPSAISHHGPTPTPIFTEFLRENGCYDEYLNNFEFRPTSHASGKSLTEFMESTQPSNYIWYAFEYYATEQGAPFWNKISARWEGCVGGGV